MKHYIASTSEYRIVKNATTAEITIQLGPTGPDVTCLNASYVAGVYDSSTEKKNPGMPYCETNEKSPTITDEWNALSGSSTHQMTLNLKTKFKQL